MSDRMRAHCRIAGAHNFAIQGIIVGQLWKSRICSHKIRLGTDNYTEKEFADRDQLWLLLELCTRCTFINRIRSARHCMSAGWFLPDGMRRRHKLDVSILTNCVENHDVSVFRFFKSFDGIEEVFNSDINEDLDVDRVLECIENGDRKSLWNEIREFYEEPYEMVLQ